MVKSVIADVLGNFGTYNNVEVLVDDRDVNFTIESISRVINDVPLSWTEKKVTCIYG